MPEAIRRGIEVCVVTLSCQTTLVSSVLKQSMDCDTSLITVRGGEKRELFTENGEVDQAPLNGKGDRKQRHIESVMYHRAQHSCAALMMHEILLIDDDCWNVEEAASHGMRGVVFNPDHPMQLCDDLPTCSIHADV